MRLNAVSNRLYVFPTPAFLAGLPVRRPTAVHARAELYCYALRTSMTG